MSTLHNFTSIALFSVGIATALGASCVLSAAYSALSVLLKYTFARHDCLQVTQGQCWLEGDNPDDSYDSCDYGPVSYHF
jgi:hypothetical protein